MPLPLRENPVRYAMMMPRNSHFPDIHICRFSFLFVSAMHCRGCRHKTETREHSLMSQNSCTSLFGKIVTRYCNTILPSKKKLAAIAFAFAQATGERFRQSAITSAKYRAAVFVSMERVDCHGLTRHTRYLTFTRNSCSKSS